jgi:Cu(I)/Ag(I) efflux system membrane protein CusA/SilA
MIASLIALCARNRLLVVMLSVVACVVAALCLRELPMDAIPDLSDTQVIVYSRWEQSPDRIEDQVTYPIITSLLGLPK